MINTKYFLYQDAIDKTLKQMAILKETCCLPVVTLYADGKTITSDATVWSSEKAKESFDRLTKVLAYLTEQEHSALIKEIKK
jgi:hypothetical protein